MPLISTSIPNLINGVSQQPSSIRFPSQGEEQIDYYSSVVDGLIKRPPTEHVAKIINGTMGSCFAHTINRDENERYIVLVFNNDLKVFDVQGNEKTVSFPDGKSYIASLTPQTTIRALTEEDYTFILNNDVVSDATSDLTPARENRALFFVKQGDYRKTYTIILDGSTYSYVSGDSSDAAHANSDGIAAGLVSAMNAALSATWTIAQSGSSILVYKKDGTSFVASCTDSLSDTGLGMVMNSVQNFTDLPSIAPHGFTTKIIGDEDTQYDEYYVKFEADGGSGFGKGSWIESVGYGVKYKLDAAVMPHVLVRNSDGTFTFKKATWGERAVGDDDSAVLPSFVGKKIRNILFFKDRLGLLADENVILSEEGEFFNFFRTTVITLLDSDPIDVASTDAPSVSDLSFGVPFQEQLTLFSDTDNFFSFKGGDLLTPKTARCNFTISYPSAEVTPVPIGDRIFYTFTRGKYSGVSEYFLNTDINKFDSKEITEHIPKYIRGSITKLTGSQNERCLIALSDGFTNGAYVYKFFFGDDANKQRLQSAWFKFAFGEDAIVKDASFIETTLYLIIQRTDGVFIEKMSLESGLKDEYSDYTTCLDRRISDETNGVTSTYDDNTETTTFTVPYLIFDTDKIQVITRYTDDEDAIIGGFQLQKTATTSTTITVDGNYANQPVWIGMMYKSEYKVSNPVIRESTAQGGKVVVVSGYFNIRKGTLLFDKAKYFRIEVTPKKRSTFVYTFGGLTVGTTNVGEDVLSSGVFPFLVQCQNTEVSVSIINDTPYPCGLLSLDWEGYYETRDRRVQQ